MRALVALVLAILFLSVAIVEGGTITSSESLLVEPSIMSDSLYGALMARSDSLTAFEQQALLIEWRLRAARRPAQPTTGQGLIQAGFLVTIGVVGALLLFGVLFAR